MAVGPCITNNRVCLCPTDKDFHKELMCEGEVEGNLMRKGELGSSVAGINLLLNGPATMLFDYLHLLCMIARLNCQMLYLIACSLL